MGKAEQDQGSGAGSGTTTPPRQADLREARLKAALKANMARRKGQAAARRTPDGAGNENKE